MNAPAQALELSQALAQAIGEQLPDLADRTEHAWQLPHERNDLATLSITTTPIDWDTKRHSRTADRTTYRLSIGFIQLLTGDRDTRTATIDNMIGTVADVVGLFEFDADGQPGPLRHVPLARAEYVSHEQPVLIDQDGLDAGLAYSELTITFQADTDNPEE